MFKFFLITFISAITSFTIIQLLKTTMFNRSWAYPLLLAAFPMMYMFFALWINDKSVLKNEFIVGVLFFSISLIYIRYRKLWVEYLLAVGFLLHTLYGITHDWFFINMGVPIWWSEFSGTVSVFIGFYLLFLLKKYHSIQTFAK